MVVPEGAFDLALSRFDISIPATAIAIIKVTDAAKANGFRREVGMIGEFLFISPFSRVKSGAV